MTQPPQDLPPTGDKPAALPTSDGRQTRKTARPDGDPAEDRRALGGGTAAPRRRDLELARSSRPVEVVAEPSTVVNPLSIAAAVLAIGVVALAGYLWFSRDDDQLAEVAGINVTSDEAANDDGLDGTEPGSIEAGQPVGADGDTNDSDDTDDNAGETDESSSDAASEVDIRVVAGAVSARSAELSVTATPCVTLDVAIEPGSGSVPPDECARDHSIRLDDLEPNTAYTATLTARSEAGVGAVEVIDFTTRSETEPVPPSVSLEMVSVGRNDSLVRVLAVPCVVLAVDVTPAVDEITGETGECKTTHELTLSTLSAGTDYEVSVDGTSENGLVTSDVARFTTAPAAEVEITIAAEAEADSAELIVTSSPCLNIEVRVEPTGAVISGTGNGCQTQHAVDIVGLDVGVTYSVTVVGASDEDQIVTRQILLTAEPVETSDDGEEDSGDGGDEEDGAGDSAEDATEDGDEDIADGGDGDAEEPEPPLTLEIIEVAVERNRATFTVVAEPCADISVNVTPAATIVGDDEPCQARHQIVLTDLIARTAYAVEVIGVGDTEETSDAVTVNSTLVTTAPPPPPAAEILVEQVTETSAVATVIARPCVSVELRLTSTELGTDRNFVRSACETEHRITIGSEGDIPLEPGVAYRLSAFVRSEDSSNTATASFRTVGVSVAEQLELTNIAVTPVEAGVEVVFASSKCGTPAIRWFQAAAQDVGGRQLAGTDAPCVVNHRALIPNLAPGTDYVVNITVVTPDGERARRTLEFRTP